MNVLEEVRQHQEHLIGLRRDFHRHPELSWNENRTQKVICRELDELEIPYETVCNTGVIAVLQGSRRGPVIGLRADMDALPITEKSSVEYA